MERTGRQLTEAETKRFAYLTDPATGEQSLRGKLVELATRHEAGQHEYTYHAECYHCQEDLAKAERDAGEEREQLALLFAQWQARGHDCQFEASECPHLPTGLWPRINDLARKAGRSFAQVVADLNADADEIVAEFRSADERIGGGL